MALRLEGVEEEMKNFAATFRKLQHRFHRPPLSPPCREQPGSRGHLTARAAVRPDRRRGRHGRGTAASADERAGLTPATSRRRRQPVKAEIRPKVIGRPGGPQGRPAEGGSPGHATSLGKRNLVGVGGRPPIRPHQGVPAGRSRSKATKRAGHPCPSRASPLPHAPFSGRRAPECLRRDLLGGLPLPRPAVPPAPDPSRTNRRLGGLHVRRNPSTAEALSTCPGPNGR